MYAMSSKQWLGVDSISTRYGVDDQIAREYHLYCSRQIALPSTVSTTVNLTYCKSQGSVRVHPSEHARFSRDAAKRVVSMLRRACES